MKMGERLDVIVFGATGFTGKHTLPYIHRLVKAENKNLRWGVAARNKQRLKATLKETCSRIGLRDLSHIPIIIANVDDEDSIKRMTNNAKVIVNCCGPYALYGEVVVKACVESGTHYVDVSGEPQFVESMLLKYHEAAEKKGVYIVSTCGFDSVAAELGTLFLERNFKGTLNSVEIYVNCYEMDSFSQGPKIFYGTWASIVHSIGNYWCLSELRKQLYPTALPTFRPKLRFRFPHKIDNKWALPFPGIDSDVIKQSQRYFYEKEGKRPIQVKCYTLIDTFVAAVILIIVGLFFILLCQFEFGRNLLLRYPEFFSCGLFTSDDISDKVLDRMRFSSTIYGKGWKERDVDHECKIPINKTAVARVNGMNPGYGFTCISVALCALIILTEPKQLPSKGGVYTPGIAFSKTSLMQRLQDNGTVFEILPNKGD